MGLSTVISVDLAYRRTKDLGIAVIDRNGDQITVDFVEPTELQLTSPIVPEKCAHALDTLAKAMGARVLLLDGPQAWKSASNGCPCQRVCEKRLNTPAKTGEPGACKPNGYLPFVQFSIDVFEHLAILGWCLLPNRADFAPTAFYALEVFPTASWAAYGLKPLPAKQKCSSADLDHRFHSLESTLQLQVSRKPNHDELQALVAGLCGLSIAENRLNEVAMHGTEPTCEDGVYREGYIVTAKPIGAQ